MKIIICGLRKIQFLILLTICLMMSLSVSSQNTTETITSINREHLIYVLKVIEENSYLKGQVRNYQIMELEYKRAEIVVDSIQFRHQQKEILMQNRIDARDEGIKIAEGLIQTQQEDIVNANAEIKKLNRKLNRKSFYQRIMASGYGIIGIVVMILIF